jgi:nucleoside-diphosphate-sugar epimerase
MLAEMLPARAHAGREPTSVAVTGGAGALGRHVLRHLVAHTTLPVRVLVHRTPLPSDLDTPRITPVRGSLLDPASLDAWLGSGAAVVHLAWSSTMTLDDHLTAVRHLSDAAARAGVTRFVHCSTAVVAGRTAARVVTEDTPCEPATAYERHKYQVEHAIERASAGRVRLAILRPTAIFGPGLQNLVSLLESLRHGRWATNYARASLFGRRQLHLVPVETVAAAFTFAALDRDGAATRDAVRYIVSADGEAGGDFRSVERRIRRGLGLGAGAPPLPVPAWGLRRVLAATGRSDTDPLRLYDGSRLRAHGFVPPTTVSDALDRYVAWYRAEGERQGAA